MKTFKRPVLEENIGMRCDMYKEEMYEHLVSQYQGKITEEAVISYIKSLIKEQDEMGFWGFVNPREVEADIRVYYFYEPTYIAVATIMFYWCSHKGKVTEIEGFEEALKKGLGAAIGRAFKGSGYDEVRGIAQALKYLAYGNVDTFTKEYPEVWLPFTKQFKEARNFLSTLLREGNTKNAWGDEFKQDIEEALELLKETKEHLEKKNDRSWVWIFVYGTLMQGERNHRHYMSEALFEGNYYLKDYAIYELDSFPGIVPLRNHRVTGELYRIKVEHLEELDKLEGEGTLYKRQRVQIMSVESDVPYTESEVSTYVYLGNVEGRIKVEGKWESVENRIKRELLGLYEEQMTVLAYLKAQPHRRTIEEIASDLNRDKGNLVHCIDKLKDKKYIRQDSTDARQNIKWNDDNARYYTEPGKIREIIAELFEYEAETKSVSLRGNYVWYVAYGSNLLYERFVHYIQGGKCRFNQRSYPGCTDKTLPLAIRNKIIPYEMYMGKQSSSWNGSGVAFLDPRSKGETWGRMYLITREQFKEVQEQEGENWYDEVITLDCYLGIEIKTITSSRREKANRASMSYERVIEAGLREAYKGSSNQEINEYLDQVFKHEQDTFTEEEIHRCMQDELKYALVLSPARRRKILGDGAKKPRIMKVNTEIFIRNQIVVAERLAMADGRCEKCGSLAPFIRKSDGTPYLEVHHIKPLAEGGVDDIDNTIALCPNCHREVHLG